MLKFESSPVQSLKERLKIRTRHLPIFSVIATLLALLASASAQNFTLSASPFSPVAVAPGGNSSSNITVGAQNLFTGTVNLSCQVTSTQATASLPACTVSPSTVTVPANAVATITTTGLTSTVAYSITITGTDPATSATLTTTPQNLTVLAVAPQFTITVQSPVVPSSVPAGTGAQGTIVINPINGYTSPTRQVGGQTISGVTLACATITPLVTIPPICSFSYPPNETGVPVNGAPATSTLTISTYGPVVNSANASRRGFYAFWFALPMLSLVGLGAAAGKRTRKAGALLALFIAGGALLLMPACGSNTATTTTSPNGVTPSNTYTFTIVGVDANGVASSNTTATVSANPTVTLTVTTAQ